ncbi:hypothetical protein [Rummeliibacillus pycnus]|uniref:hypothetical protein n=1 Tax=Rummeliibacillus pycnus TaxID=101070 RepID=UPI003D277C05
MKRTIITIITIVITAAVILSGVYFYNQYTVKANKEKIESIKQAEKEKEIEKEAEMKEEQKILARERIEKADKSVKEDPNAVIETAEMSNEGIDNTEAISYGELDKAADRYKDKPYFLSGVVEQAIEENGETVLRVSVLGTNNEFLVHYQGITDAVEGNVVNIDSIILGKESYSSGMGVQVTLPALEAYHIEVYLE